MRVDLSILSKVAFESFSGQAGMVGELIAVNQAECCDRTGV